MIEQVRSRMAELEREHRAGEQQLAELLRQEAALRETMLRISGALQVLGELIAADAEAVAAADVAGPPAGTAGNGTRASDGRPGAVLTAP